MAYRIAYQPGVQKQLRRLPTTMQVKIVTAIDSLSGDPRPQGCKKLKNRINRYRIRVGDYRVIYAIQDAIVTVEVLEVGHRSDIYR